MTPVAEWLKIDSENPSPSLQAALEKLSSAEGELVLDFSAVARLQTDALVTLDRLASTAENKNVKIALRGISVDVYRVLKLSGLSSRFSELS